MQLKATDAQIIDALKFHKSIKKAALSLDMSERRMHERVGRIEQETGEQFALDNHIVHRRNRWEPPYPEIRLKVDDAVLACYSDSHFWPGTESTAYRALVELLPQIRPSHLVDLGDSLDAASISRHPPIGWENKPRLEAELDAMTQYKRVLRGAAKGASAFIIHSNHAQRFDTYFASHASEMRGIRGTRLADHVEEPIYLRCFINDHTLLIHSIRSGIHAQYNNVQAAHISVISGHLHSQQCRPRTTLSRVNGGTHTIYGVDVGMLAPCEGPQFNYRNGTPSDWRSGFCVLTFRGGVLMPPEFCYVIDEDAGEVFWRGQMLTI
jgi:hypothetical protein